jgi:hypothetical protein
VIASVWKMLAQRGLSNRLVVVTAGLLLTPPPAFAAPQPMTLTPTFSDALTPKVDLPKKSPACVVHIASLTDERRAPEVVGVVDRRAVYAPKDIQAWLRAIVGGLQSRGITLEQTDAPVPAAIEASFTLQTIWITESVINVMSTAVMKVQAKNGNGQTIDQFYRGNMLKTGYWSDGPGVIQASIDGAFSKVLDAAAKDFLKLCKP